MSVENNEEMVYGLTEIANVSEDEPVAVILAEIMRFKLARANEVLSAEAAFNQAKEEAQKPTVLETKINYPDKTKFVPVFTETSTVFGGCTD